MVLTTLSLLGAVVVKRLLVVRVLAILAVSTLFTSFDEAAKSVLVVLCALASAFAAALTFTFAFGLSMDSSVSLLGSSLVSFAGGLSIGLHVLLGLCKHRRIVRVMALVPILAGASVTHRIARAFV